MARRAEICLIFALLLALLAWPAKAGAQEAVTMEVVAALEGNYAPGRWLPLAIVLRNSGPPARVTVAAALPGARARNTAEVDVPGGGEASLQLYVAMDRQSSEVIVSLERDGVALTEQRVAVRPREGERIMGLVSSRELPLLLPRRQDLVAQPFLPFTIAPEQLPDRPAGFSSFTLLLLNDIPAESLAPAQLEALHAWVRGGGHLVVGGGPGGEATIAGLPEGLRVAAAGATEPLDTAALGDYVEAQPPPAIQGLALEPAAGAVSFGDAATPLWIWQNVGAGRVTQLAFDPSLEALQSWGGAPALWDRLLRPARLYNTVGLDSNAAGVQSLILSGALGNLPPINLPNTLPLFVLLAVYTILIGPGMALLLHRLDRQAFGWVMLPAFAIGVAVIAGGIAIGSRADQRIVSQVVLVEQIDEDTARALAGLGILTPRDERFRIGVGADAVVRPLSPASARFGAIEGAAGAMAQEGAELELDVSSWALQGVQLEALVGLPSLSAEIVVGEDRITATARNTTGQPLRDVRLVYAGQVVNLGDLGLDEVGSATWPGPQALGTPRPQAATPLSRLMLGEALALGQAPGSAPERRTLLEESLINAAAAPGPEGVPPGPLVFAWLDTSPLPLTLDMAGAATQQVGLLVGRPRISGSGPVALPAGWMQLAQDAIPRPTCSGPQGLGLVASPAPLTITLALPSDLSGLSVSDLAVDLQSERDWPNAGVTTELYNWQSGEWVEVNFDGPGTLTLGNAGSFVQGGRLQVRLSGQIEQAGCVFADATLRGALP